MRRFPGWLDWLSGVCVVLVVLLGATPSLAEKGKLRERLLPSVMDVVYAGAERLGAEEGSPPAIPVYKGDKLVAYVFSTFDVIGSRGYSATPFDVIAGVDLAGRITGAKVVFHTEPIIVEDPGRQRDLDSFLAHEAGRSLTGGSNALPPDYVAGATISSRAMHAAVLASARLVLRARLARPAGTAAVAAAAGTAVTAAAASTVDLDTFTARSLDELVAEGAVVRRSVTSGEVAAALAKQGASGAKLDWPLGSDNDLYIEFVTALATPAAIGGNLLGMVKLEEYKGQLPDGANAIIVASRGPYDFIGTKYNEASEGFRFDRLRVIQGAKTFRFVQNDYMFAVPMPGYQTAGLFALPAKSGFDPKKPWRLELLVNSAGPRPVTVAFGVDYKLPASLPAPVAAQPAATASEAIGAAVPDIQFDIDSAPPVPAWIEAWSDARVNVAILAALLAVLTAIFILQAQLARHRLAHMLVRNGFLLVVLVWLGWTAGVQLSIVNVMNYIKGPFEHMDVGFYLAEPLMVMVAAYTLISLLLIGRGVFCGWLCPFGALQELLGQAAKLLQVPQWNPPAAIEKRLWIGKYVAAAAVLLLVLSGMDASGATTEVEPFRTAITSKFVRAWPFVIYAGAVLAIGLFSERAFCRFLCPLGGVLAVLDRLHLLNLLKRRPECGSPCRLCERACPVRAILPTGKIVTSECFQCLDCQVEFYDDKRCPPLVRAVKLRSETIPVATAVKNA